MNDFTKLELEILKRAMNFWVGENAGKVIKGKLQSMIDKYCEHEWKLCEDYHKPDECIKCGECVC